MESADKRPNTSNKKRNRKKEKLESKFEVEEMITKNIIDGKICYLLKWKGYDKSKNSWEPLLNLTNCSKIIEQFELSLSSKAEYPESAKSTKQKAFDALEQFSNKPNRKFS